MQFQRLILTGGILLAACTMGEKASALELQVARVHPDDMALTGPFRGLPAGETRFISRSALAALSGLTKLHERLTPSLPEVELTVLPLSALLAVLPLDGDTDGIMLVCEDRWQSVLPLAFIHSHEPYLLLYYEGRSPAEGWPKFSNVEAFAPYYINVSMAAHPEFNGVIDEGMISGTQVIELRAVNVQRHYLPFYEGELAHLSEKADAGRKIFIRECNNCHQGPGGVGGNTSQRPLLLLQTHATLNEEFFRKMVRRPKDFYPNTVMPSHEHFGEDTFGPLIAFLRESRAATPNGCTLILSMIIFQIFGRVLYRLPFRRGLVLTTLVASTLLTSPPSAAAAVESEVASGHAIDAAILPHYNKINTARTLLSPEEITAALVTLPGWKAADGRLTKTFVRKNFLDAIAFINALAPECERLDHHPEIFNVYNKVNLTLTTFDAGQKISSYDVLLAGRIEALVVKPPVSP